MCKIFREFLRLLSRLMAPLSSVLQFHPNHSLSYSLRQSTDTERISLSENSSLYEQATSLDVSFLFLLFSFLSFFFFFFISDTRYRYSIFPVNGNPDGRGSFSRHVQHRKMIEFYTRVYTRFEPLNTCNAKSYVFPTSEQNQPLCNPSCHRSQLRSCPWMSDRLLVFLSASRLIELIPIWIGNINERSIHLEIELRR